MTLRLERQSDGERSTLRLIGNVRPDDLDEIANELKRCGPRAALDLDEITVVGVEVIHFLDVCERQGTELLRCPAYVREWISREADPQA